MFQWHSNHKMKRARNERERGDGVPLCNAVSWWGISCDALERLPLSRWNWAQATQDLFICPDNVVALVPGQGCIWSQCRVQQLSQVSRKDVHSIHKSGCILNNSLLSQCFSGERRLRGVLWQAPSSEARPCAKLLTNRNCLSRTMLKPGHLIVSLMSDPVCLMQCHRSHPPPSWGSLWDQIWDGFYLSFMFSGDK